jgi:hypothetical protein
MSLDQSETTASNLQSETSTLLLQINNNKNDVSLSNDASSTLEIMVPKLIIKSENSIPIIIKPYNNNTLLKSTSNSTFVPSNTNTPSTHHHHHHINSFYHTNASNLHHTPSSLSTNQQAPHHASRRESFLYKSDSDFDLQTPKALLQRHLQLNEQ